MGLAGAVQAHFIGFIAPENYVPMLTFQVWAMLIVGGSGNNRGAILGAVLVWAVWAASAALISGRRAARAAGARRRAADRADRRRHLRHAAACGRAAFSARSAPCRATSTHARSKTRSSP